MRKRMRVKGERLFSLKGLTITLEVIIAVIIVTSAVIVLSAANSVLEEGKSAQRFNLARQLLTTADAVVREMSSEAPGSMRVLKLDSIEGGELVVSGKSDTIKYQLLLPRQIFQEGMRFKEGNLLILSGPHVEAYEADIDGDGSDDLVLENRAVLFAMRKNGTPGSPVAINTTKLIVQMREKRLPMNVTNPISLIAVNDLHNSTYGTGWTEFTRNESFLPSNSIRVVMNTTEANISYIAEFTLTGAGDFVEMQVKNIRSVK
ncbi:MAG: hypothetical protein HY368_00645 [Candidatus Aenigmarchaeota archaeon]|nr:hypothetical protein [Candidatus Aenigmarchaeota archaeon]